MTVFVTDVRVLQSMLALPATLWVGVKFCVSSAAMAAAVRRMLPSHVVECEVSISATHNARVLGSKADSPLEYLHDLLYAEPGMPDGCVSSLLACEEEHRG